MWSFRGVVQVFFKYKQKMNKCGFIFTYHTKKTTKVKVKRLPITFLFIHTHLV